jgi:tetratricopeptide (TPR) repeat protein
VVPIVKWNISRNVILILVGFFLCLPPRPARAQDDRFSDRLEEIRKADSGSERLRLCRTLLEQDPPPAVAATCHSVIQLETDQPDSARAWADRFFAAGGYVGPGALVIAEELDRGGRLIAAMHVMQEAVARAPDEAILQARLGAMDLIRGDTTGAAQCEEAVARLHGDFIGAARRTVRLYARWERIPEAVVLLYRLAPRAETPSEYAAIQRDLGFAALGLGDTLQARVSLREAETWRPTREVRDALQLLRRLEEESPEQRQARARARAEEALGWKLAPSPAALMRLDSLRRNDRSCLIDSRDRDWRPPESDR